MNKSPAVQILQHERDSRLARIRELDNALRDERSAVRSIDDAIARLTGVNAPLAPSARYGTAKTKLKDLIYEAISTADGGMRTTQIVDWLNKRGRPTDLNSALSTISRMKLAGQIVKRDGNLWYVLTSNAPKAETLEASD